jgi:hypothetical protein
VIHRDIKPANLLIAQRGECKITDFGIAHIDTSHLTQAGTMIGPPRYMSPEQFTGEPIDARADLFSAAVVLYEMLTGICPFEGTPSVVMQKILNEPPRPPSTLAPELPHYIDRMLLKALARRPDDRFGSAREWRDALLAELGVAQPDDPDRTRVVYAKPAAELDVPATQWPPELIAQIEQRLAGHVGPVATLLMRRATASATDIDSLHERLATYLPTDAARRDFDVLFSQVDSGPPGASASAVKFTGIKDEMLKDATSRLATYIGPIARVVAKRAAAHATDTKTFYARLLVAVPEQKDRDALGREWGIARD